MLEQGLRDRLAVAPLLGPGQAGLQGVAVGRGWPADLGQDSGGVGLGGRPDQASGDHLLKGPITLRPPRPGPDVRRRRAGPPQQGRALGGHRGAYQAGGSSRFQGLQVQRPLALPGGEFLPPSLQQGLQPPSVRAEPRCSTIRRTPPDLDTICTAVAPEAVLTLRTNGLTPVHHTDF